MKSPKSNLDLHPESRTSGLAFVVMYAMAHFLLLACVTLLYMFDTTLFNDLLTMKVLIAGHIVISLFILLPISYMFGNQNDPESLTMTRMKGYKSEKSKSLLGTLAFPIALYISSIAMFHFISVLFGAPLIKEVERTCHFAALLSSSAVLPSMIIFGCSVDKWVRIFINHETMNAAEYVIKVTSVASIVGAWLGAFPIPLDWDRHWQLWPVSCTIGSVLGFNLGLLGGIANIQYRNVRYGKKQT